VALNVFLIITDALRHDHCGYASGTGMSLTPNLDEFASDAIVFENTFAAGPMTSLAMPAMLTSRYPSHLRRFESVNYGATIEGHATLIEALRESGYDTAGIHSNPFLSRMFGYDRGLNYFYDDTYLCRLRLPRHMKLMLNLIWGTVCARPAMTARQTNRRVLKWLNTCSKPFFMWAQYMDAHGPCFLSERPAYLERRKMFALWRKAVITPDMITSEELNIMKQAYRYQVSYLDEQLGKLLSGLREKGVLDNSILILTSDHGESFGERGKYAHQELPHDELLRVPTMVMHPDYSGERVKDVNTHLDLLPSVLSDAGISRDEDWDGRPLVNWKDSGREYVISEARVDPYWHGCCRTLDWKLVWNEKTNALKLYNVREDPEELVDVSEQHPDVLAKYRGILEAHKNSKDDGNMSVPDDELLQDRLKLLGYLATD